MHHEAAYFATVHGNMIRNVAVSTLILALAVVVKSKDRVCYVEWPHGTPMDKVVEAIRLTENAYAVAFDLLDAGMWEEHESGYRLHGIFKEDLMGEECEVIGIGSR